MLNESDKEQLKKRGISEEQVLTQLKQFEKGFPFADIQRAATVGDGIAKIDKENVEKLRASFRDAIEKGEKFVKFVPASGAATRMFKSMFEFKNSDASKQAQLANEKPYKEFFERISDFAFYDKLMACNPKTDADKIALMLDEKGLGYGQKPKGVLLFHRYPDGCRTAAEEHIVEGVECTGKSPKGVNLHFTVSPQHLDLFKQAVTDFAKKMEKEKGISNGVNISYSFQKPSTDTLAATMDNKPFRDENGNLVFRPGGHGALIENLNDIDADNVFIKNIDNVAQAHLLETTVCYKEVIAGYALDRKNLVNKILRSLDSTSAEDNEAGIKAAVDFMQKELKTTFPADFSNSSLDEKKKFIYSVLDRPLRVCGMVKNEGEPGGGPFWVKGADGQTTLQVVESAQIDTKNPEKNAIFQKSTHFNPVDLFCCITDRNGKKYDLTKFVDRNAGFISYKSLNGKDLKAMELPGLWNGAMANWLTFFVEVPIETFNPVKTVMDLLRPQHQPKK